MNIENETVLILKINGVNLRNQINRHNPDIVHELITEEDLVVIDSMSRLKERVSEQNESVPVQQIFQEEQSIFVKKNGQLETVASNFPQYPEIHFLSSDE